MYIPFTHKAVIPDQAWSLSQAASDGNRDALAQFWLSVPVDQLEALWSSYFGTVTSELIRTLTPSTSFTSDQVAFRDKLNSKLQSGGLTQPLGPQLLIAVFLYSPPGLMEVANPHQNMPAWLSKSYLDLYSKSQHSSLPTPVVPQQQPASDAMGFGPFPSSLHDLVANRIHLNRILGLSNLYYIDPEDREICQELLEVRTQLVHLISLAPEVELESIWSGDFGDRYWSMVRSGIQREARSSEDEKHFQNSVQRLNPAQGGGFGVPGATNSFLIAMLYFQPGTMQVADAENQVPSWLFDNYIQIFQKDPALAQD